MQQELGRHKSSTKFVQQQFVLKLQGLRTTQCIGLILTFAVFSRVVDQFQGGQIRGELHWLPTLVVQDGLERSRANNSRVRKSLLGWGWPVLCIHSPVQIFNASYPLVQGVLADWHRDFSVTVKQPE